MEKGNGWVYRRGWLSATRPNEQTPDYGAIIVGVLSALGVPAAFGMVAAGAPPTLGVGVSGSTDPVLSAQVLLIRAGFG